MFDQKETPASGEQAGGETKNSNDNKLLHDAAEKSSQISFLFLQKATAGKTGEICVECPLCGGQSLFIKSGTLIYQCPDCQASGRGGNPTVNPPCLTAAVEYQKLGWFVLPIIKGKKQPCVKYAHRRDQRPTQEEIRGWWKKYPSANVGMVTGPESGVDTVDVDSQEAFDRLSTVAELPDTIRYKTGRDGFGQQYLFKHRPGLKTQAGVVKDVDIRTTGGITVLPPSVHKTGRKYQWIDVNPVVDGLDDLFEWPDGLFDFMVQNGAGVNSNSNSKNTEESKMADLSGVAEPGRNDAIFKKACSLRAKGISAEDAKLIILKIAENCNPTFPESEAIKCLNSAYKYDGPNSAGEASNSGWPDPDPLPDDLKPVEPFLDDLIPSEIRPWVEDIGDRMQCPKDFLGIAAMVCLGTVIGRKVSVRPKQYDDFSVIPNLWGVIIGPPSAMKSPALSEIMKPLNHLEVEAKGVYDEEQKEYNAMAMRVKIQQDLAKDQAKKDLKNGRSPQEIDRLFAQFDEELQECPARRRFIVNDATVEKLGELLNENRNGLLQFRDEIYGWLKTISREDRTNDRTFYLESWKGDGRYAYDRIGRGTIDIENICVSILGGIQPGRYASLIRGSIKGGGDDDGMAQRFQLAVYPDINKKFKIVDRWPDKDAKNRAFELFQRLSDLPDSIPGDEIPAFHFDKEAQALFYDWWTELETELRVGELHPAMEQHFVKYRSLIPSLALICHLCETPDVKMPDSENSGTIPLEALQMALGWYEYLRSHAERIYGLAIAGNMPAAKNILKKLLAGKLKLSFKKREILRAHWAGLTESEEVDAALNILIDYGYLACETTTPGPSGGRPTTIYILNPKAQKKGA